MVLFYRKEYSHEDLQRESLFKMFANSGTTPSERKPNLTREAKCLKSILAADIMVKIQQLKYSCFVSWVLQNSKL